MCRAATTWGSRVQHTVALSIVEAEYTALGVATQQEVMFLRHPLTCVGVRS